MKEKIEKLEIFKVDNRQFNTESDALAYLNRRDDERNVCVSNRTLLEQSKSEYVPVIVDKETHTVDIFAKLTNDDGSNGKTWKSLIDGKDIRYYTEPIQIVEPIFFMKEFYENLNISVDSTEYSTFVRALVYINEQCGDSKIDWKELLVLVSNISISPVHIYD
jgi:hypothetical protein